MLALLRQATDSHHSASSDDEHIPTHGATVRPLPARLPGPLTGTPTATTAAMMTPLPPPGGRGMASPRKDGDRPFQCQEPGCGRRFNRKFTLSEHMKTHTGEKPYVCPVTTCGKRFSTSGNLARHKRLHASIKPFECSIDGCKRSFPNELKLQQHLKIHLGGKTHMCKAPGCGKSFSTAGNLTRHMKNHHHHLRASGPLPSGAVAAHPEPEHPHHRPQDFLGRGHHQQLPSSGHPQLGGPQSGSSLSILHNPNDPPHSPVSVANSGSGVHSGADHALYALYAQPTHVPLTSYATLGHAHTFHAPQQQPHHGHSLPPPPPMGDLYYPAHHHNVSFPHGSSGDSSIPGGAPNFPRDHEPFTHPPPSLFDDGSSAGHGHSGAPYLLHHHPHDGPVVGGHGVASVGPGGQSLFDDVIRFQLGHPGGGRML